MKNSIPYTNLLKKAQLLQKENAVLSEGLIKLESSYKHMEDFLAKADTNHYEALKVAVEKAEEINP